MPSLICVVEQPRDLAALERTGTYRGLYHVLHGRLAPLDNMGPEQLTIDRLVQRIRARRRSGGHHGHQSHARRRWDRLVSVEFAGTIGGARDAFGTRFAFRIGAGIRQQPDARRCPGRPAIVLMQGCGDLIRSVQMQNKQDFSSVFCICIRETGYRIMRLDTTMNQRMAQTMHLAPRMIQSMEILQLPIMALQERIQQELQENPVLELKESSDEPAADADGLELRRPGRRGRRAIPATANSSSTTPAATKSTSTASKP